MGHELKGISAEHCNSAAHIPAKQIHLDPKVLALAAVTTAVAIAIILTGGVALGVIGVGLALKVGIAAGSVVAIIALVKGYFVIQAKKLKEAQDYIERNPYPPQHKNFLRVWNQYAQQILSKEEIEYRKKIGPYYMRGADGKYCWCGPTRIPEESEESEVIKSENINTAFHSCLQEMKALIHPDVVSEVMDEIMYTEYQDESGTNQIEKVYDLRIDPSIKPRVEVITNTSEEVKIRVTYTRGKHGKLYGGFLDDPIGKHEFTAEITYRIVGNKLVKELAVLPAKDLPLT